MATANIQVIDPERVSEADAKNIPAGQIARTAAPDRQPRQRARHVGRVAQGVALQPPSIPFISNVTGDWITLAQAIDPAYWAWHMRRRNTACGRIRASVPRDRQSPEDRRASG